VPTVRKLQAMVHVTEDDPSIQSWFGFASPEDKNDKFEFSVIIIIFWISLIKNTCTSNSNNYLRAVFIINYHN